MLTSLLLCSVSQSLRVDNDYGLDDEDDPFASKFMSFEVSYFILNMSLLPSCIFASR